MLGTRRSNTKRHYELKARLEMRENCGEFISMQEKNGGGGGQMMEHSGTALPTCYRIFYYYGDFSVASSFAQTVKIERRERDRAEGEQVTSSQEGETVSRE